MGHSPSPGGGARDYAHAAGSPAPKEAERQASTPGEGSTDAQDEGRAKNSDPAGHPANEAAATRTEQETADEDPSSPGHHLPPSADAIDLVIASAMALANDVPHMPHGRGSVSGVGGGPHGFSPFQQAGMSGGMPGHSQNYSHGNGLAPPPGMNMGMGMGQMPHHRTITPSGFHPAAVGLDGRVNLFVGNLPYRVRWQDVKDLFRRAGTVLRADVSLDVATNRSRGYGTVLMGSREDGVKAIEMFNGYNWQTRTLEVRPDRLPPEYEPQPHVPGGATTHHHLPSLLASQGGPSHANQPGPSPFGFHPASYAMSPQPSHGSPFQPHAQHLGHQQQAQGAFGMWQGQHAPPAHSQASLSPAQSHASPRTVPGQHTAPSITQARSEADATSPLIGQGVPRGQNTLSRDSRASFSAVGALSGRMAGLGSETVSPRPAHQEASSHGAPSISSESRNNSVANLLATLPRSEGGAAEPRRQSAAVGATAFPSMLDAPVARRASGVILPTSDREPFSLHRALADTTPIELSDSGYARSSSGSFDRGRGSDQLGNGGPGGLGAGGNFDSFRGDNGSGPPAFGGHGHSEHGGRLLTVGNLPFSMQWQELKDLFRTVGHVLRADIPQGPDKRSRGYGTVLYASEYDAETAVMRFNNMLYRDRILQVRQELNTPGPGMAPLRSHREIGIQARSPPPPILPGALGGGPDYGRVMPPSFAQQMQPNNGATHFASPVPLNGYNMALAAESLSRQHSNMGSAPEPHQAQPRQASQEHETVPDGLKEFAEQPSRQDSVASQGFAHPEAEAPRQQPNRPPPLRTGGPPHPGRITMPSFTQFTPNPLSPLQTRNMPPMTPSMPGFTFHAYPSTPPLHPMSYLSPGLGPFSPGLPYNGPSGYSFNPYMNAAPGAPIHAGPGQNSGPIGSMGNAPPLSMSQAFGGGHPPKPEYFPVVNDSSSVNANADERNGTSGEVDSAKHDSGTEDMDAIEDTLKNLRIPEGLSIPTNNRASFDGSKSAALLANFINDQRRASMDDTKRKAGFQNDSPP